MIDAEAPPQARQSRRLFLSGLTAFVLTIIAMLVGTLRFLIPNVEYGKPRRFKVGLPSDFPDKTSTYLPDQKVFIVRDGNSFLALSAVCTHLGCTVRKDDTSTGFFCPCHGSRYKGDGTNYAGPAPKPLAAYEVSLGPTGELIVDKRTLVSPSQRFTV